MDERGNRENDWTEQDLTDEEVAAIRESQEQDDTPPADDIEVS